MKDVVILGAGLSGLGCARGLPGARVYEGLSYAGGHVYSHNVDGIHFDEGAHICHSRDPAWLDMILKPADRVLHVPQSRVSNYWHGHWVTYPVQNHLNELPLDVRTAALTGFVLAQTEHRDKAPAHYLDWCRCHYGDYLTERFYHEYTRKYWRVPMEELATDWLSGRLLPSQVERIVAGALAPQAEKQSTFAAFHYPARGGFFAFFEPLFRELDVTFNARAELIDAGAKEIHFSSGARTSYGFLASSIPLPDLVARLKDAPREVSEAATRLRFVKLLCVNLVIERPDLTGHHWFYIYDNDIEASRVSVVNHLAPPSVPAGRTALQAEVFRRGDEPMDVEALVEKTTRDLGRILGFDPSKDVMSATPVAVPHAYVISDLQRAAAVETIHEWCRRHDIYPMGLFGGWRFIWSDAAYRSGMDTAEAILKRRS